MSTNINRIFTCVVERLLAREFICDISDRESYEYLSESAYREDVDQFLMKIGRKLRRTDDGAAYYCVYNDINDSAIRTVLRRQFRETVNYLEPMSKWMALVMSAMQVDQPITPGTVIRQGELLSAIEMTPALADDLSMIVRGGPFKTTKQAPKDQLNHLLSTMADEGWLLQTSPNSSVYTATGRWSYLFEVMEFIATHEDISVDESEEEQQELSL